MASRPYTPQPRRARPHKRNSQWRRDRRPRPSVASLHAALAIIPSLPRPVLDRLTQRCMDRLDEMDGDTDREWNGDELDGAMGEDDFVNYKPVRNEAGCPISDPGGGHDEREPELWEGGGNDNRFIRKGVLNENVFCAYLT